MALNREILTFFWEENLSKSVCIQLQRVLQNLPPASTDLTIINDDDLDLCVHCTV